MFAWILQYAGIDTGFLIGGVLLVDTEDARLKNVFAHSSYLGSNTSADQEGYFVIEADEYDSAFLISALNLSIIARLLPFWTTLSTTMPIFSLIWQRFRPLTHMIRMIPSTPNYYAG